MLGVRSGWSDQIRDLIIVGGSVQSVTSASHSIADRRSPTFTSMATTESPSRAHGMLLLLPQYFVICLFVRGQLALVRSHASLLTSTSDGSRSTAPSPPILRMDETTGKSEIIRHDHDSRHIQHEWHQPGEEEASHYRGDEEPGDGISSEQPISRVRCGRHTTSHRGRDCR